MAPMLAKVSKDKLYKCLECPLCGRLCQKATTIVECLHTFCHKCITKRLEDGRENFCPECNVSLGHRPFEALRLDRQIANIRLKLFPDGLELTCSGNVANNRFVNRQTPDAPPCNIDLAQELHASKMRVAELEAALEAEKGWRISAEREAGTLEHFWSKGCVLFHSLAGKGKFPHGAVSEARLAIGSLVAVLDTREVLERGDQQGQLVRDVIHNMKNVDMLLEKVNGPPKFGSEEEIVNNFVQLEKQQRQQRQRQQQQASCCRQRNLRVVREKRNSQAFEAGVGTKVELKQKRRKVTRDVMEVNQSNRHDTTRTGTVPIGHPLACHDKLGRRTPTDGYHLIKGISKNGRKARGRANLPHAVRPLSKQANGRTMSPGREFNKQCVNTERHMLSPRLDVAQLTDYQRVNSRRQRRRKVDDFCPVETLFGELDMHTDAVVKGSLGPEKILEDGKVEFLDGEGKGTLKVKEKTLELENANHKIASQPSEIAVPGSKWTVQRISERCIQSEQANADSEHRSLSCKIAKAEETLVKEEFNKMKEVLRNSSLHSVAILQDGSEREVAFKRLKTKVAPPPIPRNSKGEGPPYVPVGWGWRVGNRSRGGFWTDRCSWPPGIPRTYQNALRSDLDLLQYFRNMHPNETDIEVEARKARFEEKWPWRLPACGSGCSGRSSSGDACDISDVDWSCNNNCTEEEIGLHVCPILSGDQLCGTSAAGTSGVGLFCRNVTGSMDNREKPVIVVNKGVENNTSEGKKGEQHLWNDDMGEMVHVKEKSCNVRSIETEGAVLPLLSSDPIRVDLLTETQPVGHSFLGTRIVSGKRSVTRKRSSIGRSNLYSKGGEIGGLSQLPSSYVMAEEKGCEVSSPIVVVSEDEDGDLEVPYVLALPARAENEFDEFLNQMMTVRMSMNRVLSSSGHNICVSTTPGSVVSSGFGNSKIAGVHHSDGNGSRLLDSSNVWGSTSLPSRSSGSEDAKGRNGCENQASCLLVADSQSKVESVNTTLVEACGKVPIVEPVTSAMQRQPCDGASLQLEGIENAKVTFLHSGCTTGSLVRLPAERDPTNCSGSCWKVSQECETSQQHASSTPSKGKGIDQFLNLQNSAGFPCSAGVKEENSCPLPVYSVDLNIERPDLNTLPIPSPESQDGSCDPCNGSLLEREGRPIGDGVGVNNLNRDAWSFDRNGACSSLGQGLPFGRSFTSDLRREDFFSTNQSIKGCPSEQRFQQPDLNEPALSLDLNVPSEGSPLLEDCSTFTGGHTEVLPLEQKPHVKDLAPLPFSSNFLAAFSTTGILNIPEVKPMLVGDLSHKTVSKKSGHDMHHLASEGAWRTHANAGHCSVKDVVASVGKELKLLGKDLLSTLDHSVARSDLQTRSFTHNGQSMDPPLRFCRSGKGESFRENSASGVCRSRICDINVRSTEEQRNRMLGYSQLVSSEPKLRLE